MLLYILCTGVNFSHIRYARPPQVFYGGEIKGESAMKHLEDIGTSVVHTFQISNDGPWRAPFVEVFIGNF